MIFLDSDTLSYFLAENRKIVHRVKETIEDGTILAISSVTAYEILKGLQYRGNKKKAARFQSLLEYVEVIPFSIDVVPIAAGIYAELRKTGITIGDADILIASTVIANNGVLVTNNERHYQNIQSISLTNWSKVQEPDHEPGNAVPAEDNHKPVNQIDGDTGKDAGPE
ncbi:hypothetical protein AGMMS49944_05130 [Spirochaetia bacterium]|nr:hypothetical protein AGMMS49944_05130 [Spirochaetia bacterium]